MMLCDIPVFHIVVTPRLGRSTDWREMILGCLVLMTLDLTGWDVLAC
jgi:hypothetical protein